MSIGMLETIGIVERRADQPNSKFLTEKVKNEFLLSTREKLTQYNPTCLAIPVGFINYLASEKYANRLYNPSTQTFEQNRDIISPGWHSTWMNALQVPVVKILDVESNQTLKNNPSIPWFGDPTEMIAIVLNELRTEIGDFVPDVDSLLLKYLPTILVRMPETIVIMESFLIPGTTKAAFKLLREFLSSVFLPEGKTIVKKIKKAMNKKKDILIEKIVEAVSPFEMSVPEIPDLSLSGMVEYLGLEFPAYVNKEAQIKSLLFPGIPNSSPPGFVMTIFKIITIMVEEIIRIMMGMPQVFSIDEVLSYVMSGDLGGLIKYLFESFVTYFFAKIKQDIPEFDKMDVFACSMIAYMEKLIQLFVLIVVGHLIGPGLILQSVAELMGVV